MARQDSIGDAISRTLDLNFKKKLNEAIEEAIKEVTNADSLKKKLVIKAKDAIDKLVLNSLGLKYSFGEYKIENNNTKFYRLLESKAKEDLKDMEEKILSVLPKLDITGKYTQAFVEHYEYEVKRQAKDLIKTKATKDVEKFFNEQLISAIDFNASPEAETLHSLRLTLEKTNDDNVRKVLEDAIQALEVKALERLDNAD